MNIYMTGSHGTGKTTTAKIVAEKTGMSLAPSVSRMSPYQHGTIEHQDFVMNNVYKRCLTWDGVIHERTPFDVYAYTRDYTMSSQSDVTRHGMKAEAFARSLGKEGQPLFYFPILFPLVDDGVRPDAHMQRQVDLRISETLFNMGVSFIEVPHGTPEERADFILKELTNAKLRL